MDEIFDRIEILRQGRAHHTWLGAYGIARDTVKNIKDRIGRPSDTVLTIIARCENASFLWLREGTGTIYRVAHFDSDMACAEALSAYLSEEAWEANIISDGFRSTIVLTLQSSFQRARSGFINYTAIEVLADAGKIAISEAALNASVFKTLEVDVEVLDWLNAGLSGTYDLIGDAKHEGLLRKAELVSMSDRLHEYALHHWNMPVPEHLTSDPQLPAEEERALIAQFRTLSIEDKQLVINLINSLSK